MDYTIHLTRKCNLNCKYCYEKYDINEDSNIEIIKKVIDMAEIEEGDHSVITFYGGEPLIRKDLIFSTIDYAKTKSKKFYFNITTNGMLLDKKMVKYMKKNGFINICYSIDGNEKTHNLNRITKDNKGSFNQVYENGKYLIKKSSHPVAMCVMTKNNLQSLPESIEFLYKMGFRNINILPDYSQKWTEADLDEIEQQLSKVAEFYIEKMMKGKKISIPIFDDKIKSYIKKDYDCNDGCLLATKNIHVGTNGKFYPCSQFVYHDEYIIGNVDDGFDENRKLELLKLCKSESAICKNCKIKSRCKHRCACKNFMLTGKIDGLDPMVCVLEKKIVDISNKIIVKLSEVGSRTFMKKFYDI